MADYTTDKNKRFTVSRGTVTDNETGKVYKLKYDEERNVVQKLK